MMLYVFRVDGFPGGVILQYLSHNTFASGLLLFADLMFMQTAAMLPWLWILRRRSGLRCPMQQVAVAYGLNAALVICLAYGLAMIGIMSPCLFWICWGCITVIAAGLSCRGRRCMRFEQGMDTEGFSRLETACILLAFVAGMVIRLADPLLYVSPPSSDAFVFVRSLSFVVEKGDVITEYPAGISVLTGLLRLQAHDIRMTSIGVQLLVMAGLVSFLGFGKVVFGRQATTLSFIFLCGSWAFRDLLVFPTIFPQFATLGLVLPMLLAMLPAGMHHDGSTEMLGYATLAMLLLAMTSTYYALLLTAVLAACLACGWLSRRLRFMDALRCLPLLLVTPVFIAFYFGVALPLRLPAINIDVAEQSSRILGNVSLVEATARVKPAFSGIYAFVRDQHYLPSFIRSGLTFVLPERIAVIRESMLETVFIGLSLLAGVLLLVYGRRRRGASLEWIGFMILALLLSTTTGVLELPGYQGRALYLLLFLVIPAGSHLWFTLIVPWLAATVAPRLAWLGHAGILYALAVLSCVPVLFSLPLVGVTVRPPAVIVRRFPEDESVSRFVLDVAREQEGQAALYLMTGLEPEAPSSRPMLSWKLRDVHMPIHITTSSVERISASLSRYPEYAIYVLAPTSRAHELGDIDVGPPVMSSRDISIFQVIRPSKAR